jgi:diketogulonate reductase-like aldo/keto reductase
MKPIQMPSIGLGTYELRGNAGVSLVRAALQCGYRLLDTAWAYHNEAILGNALEAAYEKQGLKRQDVFLTSKIGWFIDSAYYTVMNRSERTAIDIAEKQLNASLKKLRTDYLDLLLIHFPYTEYLNEVWNFMANLKKKGVVRFIGVANFREKHLWALQGEIPDVNQFEISPLATRENLVSLCQAKGIQVQAYSPLRCLGHSKLKNSELIRNMCAKYSCSLAQLVLRWNTQQGIVPLPKSTHAERIRQNISLNFEIEAVDMQSISSLNENFHYCFESTNCPGF